MNMNRLIRVLQVGIILILLTGCYFEDIENTTCENVISDTNEIKQQDEMQISSKDNNCFKVIIERNTKYIDSDNDYDKVGIYLTNDLDVILKVKNDFVSILKVDNEEQIFGNIPSDKFLCNLYVEGNKILVGTTYSFTNKYGSTAWLECYEYTSGELKNIWSSDDQINTNIIIESYNEDNNTIDVIVDEEKKILILNDEEEKQFINYSDYLKEQGCSELTMEFRIIPEYTFYDFDGDDKQELITRTIVTFGACPISEVYYSVYKFSKEGVIRLKSWFKSTKPMLGEKFEFYQ